MPADPGVQFTDKGIDSAIKISERSFVKVTELRSFSIKIQRCDYADNNAWVFSVKWEYSVICADLGSRSD